jgi:hypothetical protein
LDSLYNLYLEGRYFSNDSLSRFYKENEVFQLAFRAAKALGLDKVDAIDYQTSFPFDDVLRDVENAAQKELMKEIQEGITKITLDFDNRIESGASLLELTYYLNEPEMRQFSNYFHNHLMLLAGNENDFNGPRLTSEWYKRNLYMWSLIQKKTSTQEDKVMILVGASHAAMLELFIDENKRWEVVELKEIID